MKVSCTQMKVVAQTLIDYITNQSTSDGATLVTLRGDLGAGKTTLTQHVADILGVHEAIQSPTFVIQKNYKIQVKKQEKNNVHELVHIDAYRLTSGEELDRIGFQQTCSKQGVLILLEWPERVESALADHQAIEITIEHIDNKSREVTMICNGENILKK